MSVAVFLALGTNLGDRLANLQAAQQALSAAVEQLRFSPVYETQPWGIVDQPLFLNQAAGGQTSLTPFELLHFLKDLERHLGRQPGIRYGPRLIDLDILFYGNLVLDEPELVIPHPRLAERAFVLVPLADLAPDLIHPVLGQSVSELLAQVDCSGVARFRPAGEVEQKVILD